MAFVRWNKVRVQYNEEAGYTQQIFAYLDNLVVDKLHRKYVLETTNANTSVWVNS